MDQLTIPPGMSIIARTAGIGRNAEELQWDMSYLMQLWTAIDGAAKDNPAPILIYLESSLVIRAIRDYFSPDIGEILIDTDDIADQATAFMSVVMPDNVERVKRYRDDVPLFSRFQIEHQIETAYSRTVDLPSGGSIVIDHTGSAGRGRRQLRTCHAWCGHRRNRITYEPRGCRRSRTPIAFTRLGRPDRDRFYRHGRHQEPARG